MVTGGEGHRAQLAALWTRGHLQTPMPVVHSGALGMPNGTASVTMKMSPYVCSQDILKTFL